MSSHLISVLTKEVVNNVAMNRKNTEIQRWRCYSPTLWVKKLSLEEFLDSSRKMIMELGLKSSNN